MEGSGYCNLLLQCVSQPPVASMQYCFATTNTSAKQTISHYPAIRSGACESY